jgi:site-specific DNA recombinase
MYTLGGAIELARIRERTNRAFDAKFRQPERYKPSHRPPYGYRKIGTGAAATYEIDPAESLIVRRIYEERAAGASLRIIANRLNADGIPTPMGRGAWGNTSLVRVLERPVYVTGEHECWVTKVVRDGDNVPMPEPRPAEERYTVRFPAFIDPATAERAAATTERNTWLSARHDRPAEVGILRYGFARCGGCGRALSVMGRRTTKGLPRYACSGHYHKARVCPARATISVHLLDHPVWWWVQSVMENPARADAWRVVHQPPVVDELAVQALIEAEQTVRELEARSLHLLDNLAMLSGAAARLAAERLNGLNADIDAAIAHRDHLAATTAKADTPPRPTIIATDALAAATYTALEAMKAADPHPARTHTIEVHTPVGIQGVVVPDSWKAKRAAMTALGVTVTLAREDADGPRWVADMRLPGGTVIRGEDNGAGWFAPDPRQEFYLYPSSP